MRLSLALAVGALFAGCGGHEPPPHRPVPGDDPVYTQFNRNFAGGSHTVLVHTVPGLQGTTFSGVSNLRKVP